VLFEKGQASLLPGAQPKLQEIARILNEYPNSVVMIRGYTSSEGGDGINIPLSQNRADMVLKTLIGYGVSPQRLTSIGLGSSNPIASNDTEAGRAMNRRVEIEVLPTKPAN